MDPFAPPEKRQRHFLTLEDNVSAANRIPKEYDMVMTPDDQPIHVFSDVRENTAAAAARAAARLAAERALAGRGSGENQLSLPHDEFVLEGAVSEKFDVRPASVTDEAYRATHLRRIEEATKKTRVMGDVKGPQRTVPLPKARNITQRLDGKEDVKEKAERLEKPLLEDRLMGLFERQSLWSFKQLVAETRQPAVWLKEVLTELAVLNRRGPNTGMYVAEGGVQETRGVSRENLPIDRDRHRMSSRVGCGSYVTRVITGSHLGLRLGLFALRLAATLDGEKSISAQIHITPNATQKKMSHSLFQMVFGSEKGLIHERRRQAT